MSTEPSIVVEVGLTKATAFYALLTDPVLNVLRKTGEKFQEVVSKLVSNLLSPDTLDVLAEIGRNPVMLAALFGAQHIISVLSTSYDGFSDDVMDPLALVAAMTNRDLAMVQELLRHGAKFDCIDSAGRNILHQAAWFNGELVPFRKLCSEYQTTCDLAKMVNTCCVDQGGVFCGFNPFDAAVNKGRLQLADFYAELGADTTSAHIPIPRFSELADLRVTLLGRCLQTIPNGPVKTRKIQYLLKFCPDHLVCPHLGTTVFHWLWNFWANEARDCKWLLIRE